MPSPAPVQGNAARTALVEQLKQMHAGPGTAGESFVRVVSYDAWPTETQIRGWAREAGHPEQVPELLDLLAEAQSVRRFPDELGRAGGAAAFDQSVGDVERAHTRIGNFQVGVIPAVFQTADYARAMLSVRTGLLAWGAGEAGIAEKISVRLRRQEILKDPGKRIQVVLTTGALETLFSSDLNVQVAQLGRLITVSRLPAVELGIIPRWTPLPALPYGIRIYDTDLAVSESAVSENSFTKKRDPEQLKVLVDAFEDLRGASRTGDEARAIIQSVIDDLRGQVPGETGGNG